MIGFCCSYKIKTSFRMTVVGIDLRPLRLEDLDVVVVVLEIAANGDLASAYGRLRRPLAPVQCEYRPGSEIVAVGWVLLFLNLGRATGTELDIVHQCVGPRAYVGQAEWGIRRTEYRGRWCA